MVVLLGSYHVSVTADTYRPTMFMSDTLLVTSLSIGVLVFTQLGVMSSV